MATTKKLRSTKGFKTLDDFLDVEGVRDEYQAIAVKEVLVWQFEKEMKKKRLSRQAFADLLGTSRTQIRNLLDPKGGNVTLRTLQRAAAVFGREIHVEMV